MINKSGVTLFAETASDQEAIDNAKAYIKEMDLTGDTVKIVHSKDDDMIKVVVR